MKNVNVRPAVTLREPAELLAHGLVSTNAIADLEKVAARYAVAVTPGKLRMRMLLLFCVLSDDVRRFSADPAGPLGAPR